MLQCLILPSLPHIYTIQKDWKLAITPLRQSYQQKINLYSYEGQTKLSTGFLFGKKMLQCAEQIHAPTALKLPVLSRQKNWHQNWYWTACVQPEYETLHSRQKAATVKLVSYCYEVWVGGLFHLPIPTKSHNIFIGHTRIYRLAVEVFTFGTGSSWRVTAKDPLTRLTLHQALSLQVEQSISRSITVSISPLHSYCCSTLLCDYQIFCLEKIWRYYKIDTKSIEVLQNRMKWIVLIFRFLNI